MRGFAIAVAAGLSLGLASSPARAEDDRYIRGYVTAVAQREFGLGPADVDVTNGVVQINAPQLSADQRARLADTVRTLPGVTGVQVSDTAAAAAPTPTPANSPAPAAPVAATRGSEASTPAPSQAVALPPVPSDDVFIRATDDSYQLGLLPGKTLFDPLIADPRWPDVSGTYRAYQGSNKFADTGAANFGGSLAIYRFETPGGYGVSELGLQAGVFSTFNLNAESHDLVNADYFVALNYTARLDKLSIITRVLHQSSHLGDEYILDHINEPGFQRVNFSYEQLNSIASYDLTPNWRFYLGGGWIFDQDPDDIDRWSVQYGVEYKSPWKIGDHIRPVAAVDVQQKQYEDWTLNLSVRAGVQFEGAEIHANRLLLLLEYYTGRDPNGQFFTDNVQWWGIGLHWYF